MKEPKLSMSEQKSLPDTSKPTFDKDKVAVIFVLGGPGAGKGTQCANLVQEKGFVHLSAGDLLRAEQNRKSSQYSELISKHIREGTIVPMEVTIALLENAMKESIAQGASRFLIDGFPRKMDQCLKFEEDVCGSRFTLLFDCDEATMLSRLLKRGETSGREDDNIESIKKRFRTFVETTMPVVEYMESKGKVLKVDCLDMPENVFKVVKGKVEVALGI
ncbi:Uridylate kinase isoform B [Neolecta irregularis DAH-3]|uniref:Uridylate kinase n=1 Tax=Neolecta irregularis (strain DAH-3) TaxID=1198029 RepID=A0A1U7LX16_NEOID|nr:Uridylate kinase isoform A [Neolecta irregularis DAH-3]OLL27168.1 Uridylate kinase isoform B [Neolecta irregularis DAH-3]|eukprot:OLL27167.1 Uridylate kinase isoform A [Neolecta irregularis DAH-3]